MRTTELARNSHRRLLILIINQKHELHNAAIFIFYQGHCVPDMETWEDYEGQKVCLVGFNYFVPLFSVIATIDIGVIFFMFLKQVKVC